MKNIFKTLILTILSLALYGCDVPPSSISPLPPVKAENHKIVVSADDGNRDIEYSVVRIDGCQYLAIQQHTYSYMNWTLTHKGNCDNPIHCRQVESSK